MTTDRERDERLDLAKLMARYTDTLAEEDPGSLAALRVFAGTATTLYRPGRTRWNWFFDTEYTSIGPAPWTWAACGVGAFIAIMLIAVGLLVS